MAEASKVGVWKKKLSFASLYVSYIQCKHVQYESENDSPIRKKDVITFSI